MSGASTPPLFDAARWRELRALVERLDVLTPAAREAELERIAASDPALATSARELAGDAQRARTEALDAPLRRLLPTLDDELGRHFGAYRLVRRIGSGGMGVVYLAERRGADFVQHVALKLLDGDAARVAELAARERRVLAALAHPNITAFVDAGIDRDRAWLAMEYVDGEPLLDYCERNALDVAARVQLFDQVCAAVAHAHAQLVVHRDLKPSNVLVGADGVVKLLDFGIALVLDARSEQAPATRVFTPEYAAPEQLRGERASTATDVHALGLLLFELVSGRRLPTLEGRGTDADWTTAELARQAATATARAGVATAEPRTVPRLLRGDLGRIIAHALAHEPARRYASVALLREDLRRWLEDRPLTIVRPGFLYSATRFMRRHRAAVAVAGIAVAALFGVAMVALWQAQRATRMATRAEHAQAFLTSLFKDANPYQAQRGASTPVDLLRKAAQRIDAEFPDAPDVQADLRMTIANVLARIGEPKIARELLDRSVAQLRGLHGDDSPQVGVALAALALAAGDSGDTAAAREAYQQAYALLREAGPDHARERIEALTGLAKMANLAGDRAEAQRMHEAALAERTAIEGPDSPDIAMDLMNLASDALYQERYAQAEELATRAHAMLERTLGKGHARAIYVDNVLGLAQLYTGHLDLAVATLGAAVAQARATLQPGAPMIAITLSAFGSAQYYAGDDAASIASLREARSIMDAGKIPRRGRTKLMLGLAEWRAHDPAALATLADSRADLAHSPDDLAFLAWADAAYGAVLAGRGEREEGERFARAARARLAASSESGSVRMAEVDRLLAGIIERGAPDEARALREEALATCRRVYGEAHPRTRALVAELATGGEGT
ncbi:serine/threonine-protein kinase [Dokdonella fugitiva]|jgi:serine/threonine-protein kinase|uniref:serine/threonine-protein kinase n=1 Tax=Dokdonella fugitiva TaxID=328517 RepID=UPI0015F9BF54|nr:serine/threonine-protein kinase [Dokdonella fugitiva]MBA8885338.1 serine/threonine-protein kinase [Dokdonella fugitiva]